MTLHEAAESGDTDALRRLLAAGVDVDARDARGRTAALAATHGNHPETFRLLVDAGANLDLRDHRLDNPLLYAGAEGLQQILLMAIEAGADPHITNRYDGTALIPACERGHVTVVETLLTRSAVDVDHVNRLGWTALLEAVILGTGGTAHRRIVELLLAHGADPDIADNDGVTALAHARSRGFEDIAALLVAAGAR